MAAELSWAWAALGVPEDSPPHVVRTAWRRGVRVSHPDANGGGDVEAFHRINSAYKAIQEATGSTPAGAHPVGSAPVPEPAPEPEREPLDITDFYLDEADEEPAATEDPSPQRGHRRPRGSARVEAEPGRSAIDQARAEHTDIPALIAPVVTVAIVGVALRHLVQAVAGPPVVQLSSALIIAASLSVSGVIATISHRLSTSETLDTEPERQLEKALRTVTPHIAITVVSIIELVIVSVAVPIATFAIALTISRSRNAGQS